MAYLVKVVLRDDSVGSVQIDAEDTSSASERARAEGYVVLGVRRQRPWQGSAGGRSQKFSTVLFSQELLALITAGLSLVEALEALKGKRKYQGAAVLAGIAKMLSQGQPLSAALADYPQHFSSLYVASIQASERTGNLAEALRRLVEYQQQMDAIRKKLVSAATYPALLSMVAIVVVLFLLLYVVPRFSKVYESFSGDLPFFSTILIGLGTFVDDHGALLATGAVGAVALVWGLSRLPATRSRIAAWMRRIPIVAENARLYELGRLYRTLGMLLLGGVPITRAMTMARPLLGSAAQDRLQRADRLIREGRPISASLVETGLTTPVAHRMLSLGERTGRMGEMMERIAVFHEEDLARWVEEFSKLFEPILMLILGVMVGAIVVVMYMPIFELATAIQ